MDQSKNKRKHARPRFLVVSSLLAAALTASLIAPTPQLTGAHNMAPAALSDPCFVYPAGVPKEAYDMWEYLWDHNLTPPPNYIGGSIYRADDPYMIRYRGDFMVGTLREYDVYLRPPGQRRGPERIVIGDEKLTRMAWYTPDHYATFINMFDTACIGVHVPVI